MFIKLLMIPKALRLVNEVLEDHIERKRLANHCSGKDTLHEVGFIIDGGLVKPAALTEKEIRRLQKSELWKLYEEGQKTHQRHGGKHRD